jgi:hypothetical protein
VQTHPMGASGWTRYGCSHTASAGTTAVVAEALLTADTTEARVSLPQVRIGAEMGQYCLDRVGGSAVCNADSPSAPSFGLPTRDFHVRWNWKPALTAAPPDTQVIMSAGNPWFGGTARGWYLARLNDNRLRLVTRGSSAGQIFNAAAFTWSAAGNEMCLSSRAGTLRLFIDGALAHSATPDANSSDEWYSPALIYIGHNSAGGNSANGYYSNLRFGRGPCP